MKFILFIRERRKCSAACDTTLHAVLTPYALLLTSKLPFVYETNYSDTQMT